MSEYGEFKNSHSKIVFLFYPPPDQVTVFCTIEAQTQKYSTDDETYHNDYNVVVSRRLIYFLAFLECGVQLDSS